MAVRAEKKSGARRPGTAPVERARCRGSATDPERLLDAVAQPSGVLVARGSRARASSSRRAPPRDRHAVGGRLRGARAGRGRRSRGRRRRRRQSGASAPEPPITRPAFICVKDGRRELLGPRSAGSTARSRTSRPTSSTSPAAKPTASTETMSSPDELGRRRSTRARRRAEAMPLQSPGRARRGGARGRRAALRRAPPGSGPSAARRDQASSRPSAARTSCAGSACSGGPSLASSPKLSSTLKRVLTPRILNSADAGDLPRIGAAQACPRAARRAARSHAAVTETHTRSPIENENGSK